jgi:hypothetical protein
MTLYPYNFEAPVERHGIGRARQIWYNVLFLPPDVAADLPFRQHPQLRVEGEIADLPMVGAFLSAGDGRYYVMISPEIMKEAQLAIGQPVEMRFRVADQDAVEVPDDLARALSRDDTARAAWEALTTGKRRALAHHVATAKTPPTRARRIAAVITVIGGAPAEPALAADVDRLRWLFRSSTRRTDGS